MTRATESGAYLGGIGTMLIQSDVCPACGRVHSDRRPAFRTAAQRECPLVVFGTLPTLTKASDFGSAIPETAFETDLEEEAPPLPGASLAVPAAPARKGTGLVVPWPMPSHLEDFL